MIKRLKLLLNTKRACIGKGTAAIAKTAPTKLAAGPVTVAWQRVQNFTAVFNFLKVLRLQELHLGGTPYCLIIAVHERSPHLEQRRRLGVRHGWQAIAAQAANNQKGLRGVRELFVSN